MNKILRIKPTKYRGERGFITLEVLVSILIALAFVAVSMQSLVYAMAIKIQAQEKQRSNQLIQEDIARLNQLGSTTLVPAAGDPQPPTPVCNPVATAANAAAVPTLPAYTAYENSYANALWNALPAGTQIKNIIEKTDSTGASTTAGRQLALRRFHISSTANNSEAPHRTLKVGYQVWYWNSSDDTYRNKNEAVLTANDDPIAETYVEVIPDVALQCP